MVDRVRQCRLYGPHQIVLSWKKILNFFCWNMELGEREKKNIRQESEDERWARLDKRIEKARAR